jgi:LacI family transcriptional regulator
MHGRAGPARLRDVAAAAGVSAATVSRYLNRSLPLPPDTAARIDRAIRRLDYRPNPHARRLSLGRAETIGLVLPDIANPFFAQLAAAVEQAADAAGLALDLHATLNRPGRELDYLERMRRAQLDGVIFITNHAAQAPLVRAIHGNGRVVLIDEDVTGTRVPKVFCDNAHGGWLAGQHLLTAGHRHLAFIGGPEGVMSAQERLAGLRRAVAEHGSRASVVAALHGPYSIAHGIAAAEALLEMRPRPTAVFAASDEIVLGLLSILRGRGLRVPDQISVVAFDDVSPLDLLDPPLTAVRQPVARMGQRAVELVIAPADPASPASVERLPVELIVRSSVAPPEDRA